MAADGAQQLVQPRGSCTCTTACTVNYTVLYYECGNSSSSRRLRLSTRSARDRCCANTNNCLCFDPLRSARIRPCALVDRVSRSSTAHGTGRTSCARLRCVRCSGVSEDATRSGRVGEEAVRTLAVVDERGEDDDGEREREDEEAEFGGAALERVAENAQAGRVARELEDAKHAEHTQRRERTAELVLVREQQRHVERHAARRCTTCGC